jgi:hypothetical protein
MSVEMSIIFARMEDEFSSGHLRIRKIPMIVNLGPNCIHIDGFNVF